MASFDANGDGMISRGEMRAAMHKLLGNNPASGGTAPPDASSLATDLLSQLGANGDGSIDLASELLRASTGSSSSDQNSLASLLKAADANGDGKVSATELKNELQTLGQQVSAHHHGHRHHHAAASTETPPTSTADSSPPTVTAAPTAA